MLKFFCNLFCCLALLSQSSKAQLTFIAKKNITDISNYLSTPHIAKVDFPVYTCSKLMPILIVPANFYTANFGFFCKKEWQFEKATKIALKIRLGSVDYVDYLEGKSRR